MANGDNLGSRISDAEFQRLHFKLRRFFEWHRCVAAEDLAQDTILRGLRRLSEGQENYAENPQSYFFGIARNVLREERQKPLAVSTGDEDYRDHRDHLGALQWRILIRECMSQLSRKDRLLIVAYLLDGADKAASAHGLSLNALRIRVTRIRSKIGGALRGPADCSD